MATNLMYKKQVLPVLLWMHRLVTGIEGPLVHSILVVDRDLQGVLMEMDASPQGGGAVAWFGAVGRGPRRAPDAFFSAAWNIEDEMLLDANVGDPASQATFEAFAALLAIRTFVRPDMRGTVAIVGDALGVWHGIVRFSVRSRQVNDVAKEVAMHLAPMGRDLVGIHVWGEDNQLADALSRLDDGAAAPAALARSRVEPGPRDRVVWRYLGRDPAAVRQARLRTLGADVGGSAGEHARTFFDLAPPGIELAGRACTSAEFVGKNSAFRGKPSNTCAAGDGTVRVVDLARRRHPHGRGAHLGQQCRGQNLCRPAKRRNGTTARTFFRRDVLPDLGARGTLARARICAHRAAGVGRQHADRAPSRSCASRADA